MNPKDLFKKIFSKEKDELGKHRPENKKFSKENLPVKYQKSIAEKQLSKQFKKLRHQAIYLNIEHEELVTEFDSIRRQFIAEMLAYCSEKNIEHPFESVPDKKDKSTELSNDEMNNLFREIVRQTHPDLNKNLPEDDAEEKLDLYNEAVQGKQNGNFRKILQVALELNVKIKTITPEFISQLKKEISKMNNQINQIKNDAMYRWYHSDKNMRAQIFELITKNQKKLND